VTADRLAAADHLATTHLPLVGHVVAELSGRVPGHVSRDDLAGAGVLALVRAARDYRVETGVAFGAYARIRIRGAVVDELRTTDWASRGARRSGRRLVEARDRLGAELGRPATAEELAAALGVSVADVERMRHDHHRGAVLSLEAEAPHADAVAAVWGSASPDPADQVALAERIGALLAAVAELPDRLRAVVVGYDLEHRPMAELAQVLDVTESRISQLRSQAFAMLRDALSDSPVPVQREPADSLAGGLARRRRDAYVLAARGASDLRARLDTGFRVLGRGDGGGPDG
jgi:RNA polymerase sigma factor for flagellar operon FliA